MTDAASSLPKTKKPLSLHALACIFLAPALLTAVASAKLFGSADDLKSPWKGGAFGMFSSIDYPPARLYRVSLIQGNRVIPIALDSRFSEAMRVWKNMPADENLERAALELSKHTWAYPESLNEQDLTVNAPQLLSQIQPMGQGRAAADGFTALNVDRVRVEVWRYNFNSQTAKSDMVLVNAAERGVE